MQQPKNMLLKSVAVATMAFALAGAGAGAAWASPTPPPAPPTHGTPINHPAPPPAPPTHGTPINHPAPPLLRPVTVTDSGRVTAVNPHTLSVRGFNGRTTVFQLTPRTVFFKNGRAVFSGRIARLDRVQVTGFRVGNVETANRVVDTGR
jgi:hypothetical protein